MAPEDLNCVPQECSCRQPPVVADVAMDISKSHVAPLSRVDPMAEAKVKTV